MSAIKLIEHIAENTAAEYRKEMEETIIKSLYNEGVITSPTIKTSYTTDMVDYIMSRVGEIITNNSEFYKKQ